MIHVSNSVCSLETTDKGTVSSYPPPLPWQGLWQLMGPDSSHTGDIVRNVFKQNFSCHVYLPSHWAEEQATRASLCSSSYTATAPVFILASSYNLLSSNFCLSNPMGTPLSLEEWWSVGAGQRLGFMSLNLYTHMGIRPNLGSNL